MTRHSGFRSTLAPEEDSTEPLRPEVRDGEVEPTIEGARDV